MEKKKKLFLLDAYALIYRSYYAFIRNPIYNSKGLNTSAVFGFVNTLIEVLNKEKPTHIAIAVDPSAPTFRNDIFQDYKATREETPEDIKIAVPYIKKIAAGFNIPVIEKNGYEADDIIGTLSLLAEKADFETYMMTPDKDYLQLVSNKTFVYKPKRSGNEAQIIGLHDVLEKYQIDQPEQVIDIMALWGDTSDNIPGVPGVGEKTAQKLIAAYRSVENLIEKSDELKGKLKEKIKDNKEAALLSKKLVTIVRNIDLEFNESELAVKPFDAEIIKTIFDELEFKSLYNRLFGEPMKSTQNIQQLLLFDDSKVNTNNTKQNTLNTIKNIQHNYYLVDTYEKWKKLLDKLLTKSEFCFDTETSSLYLHDTNLVGISFCFNENEAYYVPFELDNNRADFIEELKLVFANENILKIGHNIKFDMIVLHYCGIDVKGPVFDTMVAHYLIQPEIKHSMDYLAGQYLNYNPISIESLIGKKGKNQLNMSMLKNEDIYEYACEDADITYQLKQLLVNELKEYGLYDLASKIEMPLISVLKSMELNGVNLDSDAINKYGQYLNNKLLGLKETIIEMAGGHDFNIDSPKQLGEVLFDKMKITKKVAFTRTKQYSTSEETLEKLRNDHPIIKEILEYRSLKKLFSGYIEALPKLINKKTKRIHTSFNQTITATGRLSSNNPNLQNIPIREEQGREIRKAFIPQQDDHVLLSADYSQIELRIMAHMSNDQNFISAFHNNEDIHTETASKVFHVNRQEVTTEMRSKAKTANFGIIYGISAFGLSQRLNIARQEAKTLIDAYFESYPDVKEYMDASVKYAREYGYVKTIMGRRRYLKDINSRNGIVRGMAERNAINAPIQGSASDIIKLAMIKIHKMMIDNHLKSNMILQVHDELVFDVPKDELEFLQELVKDSMENIVELKVPLLVETGYGKNWVEAH